MTEDQKKVLSEAHKGYIPSEAARQAMSVAVIRDNQRPERREHKRQVMLSKWQDEGYAREQIKSFKMTPNHAELALEKLISPLGFRFVGDGQLMVGRRCPDFWDGGTRLVELYGDYWHRGDDPAARVSYFQERGYNCLVVWESELKGCPEAVIEQIVAMGSMAGD